MSNLNNSPEAMNVARITFNKRLIAEAPAMLEALQALLVEAECLRKAYTQHLPSEWENPDSAFAQARAILARLEVR